MLFKKKRYERICKQIKEIKIQGATNVAKAALKAYYLFPSKQTKNNLLKLRPTEPMMSHVLELAEQGISKKQILNHFQDSQKKINKIVYNLIKSKSNPTIFTHCHSTNVINALIYTKNKGKIFQVYNTETRPLFQGRQTSKELRNHNIKVTQFVDSAMLIALQKAQKTKKTTMILLGADALLKDQVINKVGSGAIAQLAKSTKTPLYIVADSWKFSSSKIQLEQRTYKEVWGTKKVHIQNPAFEFIPKNNITSIITELGIMTYNNFLKKVRNQP